MALDAQVCALLNLEELKTTVEPIRYQYSRDTVQWVSLVPPSAPRWCLGGRLPIVLSAEGGMVVVAGG